MKEHQIGVEIRIIGNLIIRQLNGLGCDFEGTGLTGPQGLVLKYLYDHQPEDIFQKDIEANFNIRRSTATGLLRSLEHNGFITRIPVHHDARLKKVVLTQKAIQLEQSLAQYLWKVENLLTKDLTEQEIANLHEILLKMRKNLE